MRTIPDDVADAILRRDLRARRIDLVDAGGAVVASTAEGDDLGERLYPAEASVAVDGLAAIDRTASMAFLDPDGTLNPRRDTDLLHPFGGLDVRTYAGVAWDDRASFDDDVERKEHTWEQGVFRIQSFRTVRTKAGLVISLELDDLSAAISLNPWRRRRVWKQARMNDILTDALLDRQPGAEFDWAESEERPRRVVWGDDPRNDPLLDMRGLASRFGYRLFLDPSGVYRTEEKPDPDRDRVDWTYSTDEAVTPTPNLVETEREVSTRESFNGVQIEVESPDRVDDDGDRIDGKPYTVTVWDEDPNSPRTRIGDRVERIRSNKPMKRARAEAKARERLRRRKGAEESVSILALSNLAHESLDLVEIVDEAAGVADVHQLATFDVDLLRPGPLPSETKMRRVRDV